MGSEMCIRDRVLPLRPQELRPVLRSAVKSRLVPTSPSKFRQVLISSDKSQQVPTSHDWLRPIGQATRSGLPDLRDIVQGAWELPEGGFDHQHTFSQGPGTIRSLSGGPGNLKEQCQNTENDGKMIRIMKMVENATIWLEMN